MPRGFTLIELLLTLLVVSALLAVAAPSFERLYESRQARRLAAEFQGFFIQARSEAVTRNQDLWIHYAELADCQQQWLLALRDSADPVSYHSAANNAIMVSKGQGDDIEVGWKSIRLNRVNGKPAKADNIQFAVKGAPAKKLKLVFHNITGRIRICGGHYGYPQC